MGYQETDGKLGNPIPPIPMPDKAPCVNSMSDKANSMNPLLPVSMHNKEKSCERMRHISTQHSKVAVTQLFCCF